MADVPEPALIQRRADARARVLLLYTGGTIGMVHDETGALVPFDFGSILERLPVLAALPLELQVAVFDPPVDSADISPVNWARVGRTIAQHHDRYDGFVVLHGTDTMAYTASALSFMLVGLDRPVVLTGAQRPMTAVRGDARENLVTAIAIAASPEAPREVSICFGSLLLRGNRATKVAADRFEAFSSPNHAPLARAGVEIRFDHAATLPRPRGPLLVRERFDTRVTALRLFPGIARAAVAAALVAPGVVLETYGSGNAPTGAWFVDAVTAATSSGTVVVNVTQCLEGTVAQARYATGAALERAGAIGGFDMTFEAAVTKLMLLLGEHGREGAAQLMAQPLAGELTPGNAGPGGQVP